MDKKGFRIAMTRSRNGSGNADLARFGPTTPMRARRLADASVDPTEAR
jgi:hypothetical protein